MLIVLKEHQAFELLCHLYQAVHAWQIDITYYNICQSLYLRYTNLLGVSVIPLLTLWHWFPQFILISDCEYFSEDHWQNRTSDKMSSIKRPFETPLPVSFLTLLVILINFFAAVFTTTYNIPDCVVYCVVHYSLDLFLKTLIVPWTVSPQY